MSQLSEPDGYLTHQSKLISKKPTFLLYPATGSFIHVIGQHLSSLLSETFGVFVYFILPRKLLTFGVVAHTFDLNTQEVEAAGSEVQGHPKLYDKFEPGQYTLVYLRPCFQKEDEDEQQGGRENANASRCRTHHTSFK